MKSFFEDPSFLSGVVDPDAAPPPVNDQNRSAGQTALDFAIDTGAKPIVGIARNVAGKVRDIVDDPNGYAAATHKALGHAEDYLDEQRSTRAQRMDTLSPFDAEYWSANNAYGITPTLHHALPLAAMIGVGKGAGLGGSTAVRALGAGEKLQGIAGAAAGLTAFGALGLSQADDRLRKFSDDTSIDDLNKSPTFLKIWIENQGDELAARDALYKRMLDPVARATSFGANALTFGALKGLGPFQGLIGRALFGIGEGAVVGGVGGAAGSYNEQLGKVRGGYQDVIDPQKITEEMKRGTALAGPVGAMHVIGGGKQQETALNTGAAPKPTPTPAGADPGIMDTLDGQLNAAGHVSPPRQPNQLGAADPGDAFDNPQPVAPPGAAPAGAPAASALPSAAEGAPAGAGAPPGGAPPAGPPAGAAINTGAPPLQAQQPVVNAVPPAAKRQRTKPVTPAPTEGAPIEGAPAAEGAPPAAAPTAPPAAPTIKMWNGEPVQLMPGTPRMVDGVVFMNVRKQDGTPAYARANELTDVTPEVTSADPASGQSPEYIDWLESKTAEVMDRAKQLGLVDRIGELSKTKTAHEVSAELGGQFSPGEIRIVRGSLGIPALGPVGINIGGVPLQGPAAAVAPGSKGKPKVAKVREKKGNASEALAGAIAGQEANAASADAAFKAAMNHLGLDPTGTAPAPVAGAATTAPRDTGPVVGFKTSKGSTYVAHEDGTTTRNKAARPEHPGDEGPKAQSQKTVYVDPKLASEIGMWNTSSATGKRIVLHKGEVVLASTNAATGKMGRDRTVNPATFSETPEVGKSPLELTHGTPSVQLGHMYAGNHPGNPITEVVHGGRPKTRKAAAPAPAPAMAELVVSAPAKPAPGAKGRAVVAKGERLTILREDYKTAPAGELKEALRKTLNVHSDFDDLQAAADWGRANARPDIVDEAADRADKLAKKEGAKAPPAHYTGTALEEGRTRLGVQAQLARERAAKVRTGSEAEAIRPVEAVEPLPELDIPPAAPRAERPASDLKELTSEVRAEVPAAEPPKPNRKAPRVDDSLSARSLRRDDIVRLDNDSHYTVIHRQDRENYPQDPIITIQRQGARDYEQHRASELDAEFAAKSIVRAPEEKLTSKGNERQRPAELRVEPGTPLPKEGRKPPIEFPEYTNYVGKNKAGHEVWEDPETNLRVTRHVEGKTAFFSDKRSKYKNVDREPSKRKVSITKAEKPFVDRASGESGPYQRGADFMIEGERPVVPPRVHRVYLHGEEIPGTKPVRYEPKPETTERVEGPRAEGVREQTARDKSLDLSARMLSADVGRAQNKERRREAIRVATTIGKGEVPRKHINLTGKERALVVDINKFQRGTPTQEGWLALRRRADDADEHRVRTGSSAAFVDKLGRSPEVGGGPLKVVDTPVRSIFEVPKENVRQHELTENLGKQYVTGLRKLGNDAKGLTADQFDARRAELYDHAVFLDLMMINHGMEPRFEAMLPEAKGNADIRSDVQRADDALAAIEHLKDVSPREFLSNVEVKKYFEAVAKVNEEIRGDTILSKITGAAETFPFRLHPDWINEKVASYRPNMPPPSKIEATGAAALKAAKDFYDAHNKHSSSNTNVDTVLDKHAMAAAKNEQISELAREKLRLQTDAEQAPANLTQELKNKIADAVLSGRATGDVRKYIEDAATRIAKEQADSTLAGQKVDSRAAQYAKREEIIERATILSITDFFRDKETKQIDIARMDKFLDDLIGLKDSYEVTKERTLADGTVEEYTETMSRRLTKPEPPKILVAGPRTTGSRTKTKGGLTVGGETAMTPEGRYTGGMSASETRYQKALADYEKQYNTWRADVMRQYEAIQNMDSMINSIIGRIEFDLAEFKNNNPRSTGSINRWGLPEGRPGKGAYRDFTISKNVKGFQHFNFAVDLLKLREHLRVDLQHLQDDVTYKGDIAGWDVSKAPFEQYTRKLSPLLQQFAVDLRHVVGGDMGKIMDARADRVAEVTHEFEGTKVAVAADESGELVAVSPDAIRDAGSVTSEVATYGSVEDALNDAIDARRAAELKASTKTTDDTLPNAEKIAKQNVDPPKGKDPSRADTGNFDETGLPTGGKKWVKGEPYVRDEVDVAHDALQTNDPTHPLIDAPLTTAQTLDIVKQMIADPNVDVGDLSTAITPRFLDQVARLTAETRVVHAPYDVVSAAGQDSPAYYHGNHDIVVLPNNSADGFYAPTAVHESTHALFNGLLQSDEAMARSVQDLMNRARRYARQTGMVPHDYDFVTESSPTLGPKEAPRVLYGLKDIGEMMAEAKASQSFRQFLTRVPTRAPTIGDKTKNALNSLYYALREGARRALGKTNGDTALDVLFYDQSNVLGSLDRLAAGAIKDAEKRGRVRYNSGLDPTMATRANAPNPNDYVHPAAGTPFVKQPGLAANLKGYTGNALSRAVDTGRTLRDTNRALGLSVHTAFDKEHRTSDTVFQGHVHELNKAIASQATAAKRIMDFEDGPVIERLHNFLKKLSPGWQHTVREAFTEFNYHRAYPDAPLGEREAVPAGSPAGTKGKLTGKNKHIDPDDLANEQVVQEHAHMQQLWKNIEKIPGLRKIADETWGFYKERQPRMKSRFIRTMAELDGIMPSGLSGRPRELMLDALEKHINGGKQTLSTMTPTEKAALSRIDLEDPKLAEKIKDIRTAAREFSAVEGPYLPMVRSGDYAVYGRFHMPTQGTETVPAVDRRNGQPTDNGIRVLDSRDKAKAFVGKITKEFGITQIDGGEWYYDPTTGKRAMRYTPDELAALNKKLTDAGEAPVKNRLIRKGEAKDMMAAGRQLDVKYFVQFSPQVLEKYESLYDARKSVAGWRTQMDDSKLSITPPEQSHASVGTHSDQHVSDVMQKIINRFKAGETYGGLDKHEQAGISQELRFLSQQAVMVRGVRQRYLPRGYVLGAMNDMVKSTTDYSGATANWLAKMEHMPRISAAWKALNDYNESRRYDHGDKDSYARTAITAAMGQRIHKQAEPLVDNMLSRGVDRLVRWTMLDKLPGVSYFAGNATESVLLGIPLQLGRHGLGEVLAAHRYAHSIVGPMKMARAGFGDMARAIMGKRVSRDWQEEFKARVLKDKYGPDILEAINFMGQYGLLDQHAGLEYQQMAKRAESGLTGAADKTADYLTNIFQAGNSSMENFTRATMGISSYKLERDRLAKIDPNDPKAHEKALRYMWDISNRTSGVYANYNAPELFQKGPIARLIFEFKKYPQRILSNNIDAMMGGLKLFDPNVRADPEKFALAKEKAKTFAALLVMQGMAGGVLGLPTEIFSAPVNMLYMAGLTPYNWEDYKAQFRAWAGEIPSYGLLNATGINFQSKLDQSNMIFFGSPQSTKAMDLRGPILGILGGAGGGVLADALTAGQKLAQASHAEESGNYSLAQKLRWEAARLGIPFKLATDLISAGQMGTEEGRETASGHRRGKPLGLGEQLVKAAGFDMTRVANEQEKSRVLHRMEERYKAQKAQFTTEFSTGNAAEQGRVWQRVQKWNEGLPNDLHITYSELKAAEKTRRKAEQAPLEHAGVALDKRGKAFLGQLHGVYD